MPRRLRVQTSELGPLELFVIYADKESWEGYWQALQGTEIASLFTEVSKETYDHALVGWTRPLITQLGLDPKGALRKLPVTARQCAVREGCPFYDKKHCTPSSAKMPWCFQPNVGEDSQKRSLSAEVIGLWREGVYVVVVQEA